MMKKKKIGLETKLIEAEQLNIGITSLLKGQNFFKNKDLDTIIKKIMEKL